MKRILPLLLALCLFAPAPLHAATVTDYTGAPFTLDAPPQRIVSLPVWATEMLLDMVDNDRIVGVSAWSTQEAISATAQKAAAIEGRASVGDVEGLLALMPDLVVLDTFSDYDGALTKTLQDAGIPVLCLASPTDFASITTALQTLGMITDASDEAAALITAMEATLTLLADTTGGLSEAQRVRVLYYEDYYDASGASAGMLCAYGRDSSFQALCDAAGVINVCDAPLYSAVSKEKVVAQWQPELLIVPGIAYDAAFNPVSDEGETLKRGILADSTLSTLPAVQGGNIVALKECYRSSTSHYMAQGALDLAIAAYPEYFAALGLPPGA